MVFGGGYIIDQCFGLCAYVDVCLHSSKHNDKLKYD